LPRWPNQLELIAQASDFATEADTWRFNALDSIAITRCDELHQWRGSSFSIREGDDAREVAPQVYSPNTSVDASISLSCITFDRRGHGRSDQPAAGYDFDTLADDLDALMRFELHSSPGDPQDNVATDTTLDIYQTAKQRSENEVETLRKKLAGLIDRRNDIRTF